MISDPNNSLFDIGILLMRHSYEKAYFYYGNDYNAILMMIDAVRNLEKGFNDKSKNN